MDILNKLSKYNVCNGKNKFHSKKGNEIKYFQVTYLLSGQDVIKREIENLLLTDDQYPKFVISLDDVQFTDYKGIRHIRALDIDKIL